MIALGAALVEQFYWTLYLFAAFLIATGVKMLFSGDQEMDVAQQPGRSLYDTSISALRPSCMAKSSSSKFRTKSPARWFAPSLRCYWH